MKKVLALVLAVLMLATVAFAARASVTPGTKIKISRDKLGDFAPGDDRTSPSTARVFAELENGTKVYFAGAPAGETDITDAQIKQYIMRSVTSENYSVTNVKIQKVGKSLVEGVKINDAEDRVEVILKDDLNNTSAKDFEVTFKLKGKVKFTVKDSGEVLDYNAQVGPSQQLKYKDNANNDKVYSSTNTGSDAKDAADNNYKGAIGKKVSLPDLDFTVAGTVGYGKVEVSVGDDGDEELENLESLTGTGRQIDLSEDVIKFVTGPSGSVGTIKRVAGAYTADAILTQEYGDALTLEARVYKNDVLFFDIDNAPDRDIIGRLADSDADMDFYVFNSDTKFTTFNSNAKLYFNDAEEDDFVYQIKDKKLVKVGEYSEDDGCWVVKTRTLGAYVVSDVELTEFEAAAGTTDGNPDTGANDVVGIATALAAVALVSAAAVSLKK